VVGVVVGGDVVGVVVGGGGGGGGEVAGVDACVGVVTFDPLELDEEPEPDVVDVAG
jgi:hypothetical protein